MSESSKDSGRYRPTRRGSGCSRSQHHATEIRILEDGTLIARDPLLEGKSLRRVDPAHRKAPPVRPPQQLPVHGLRRLLEFYDAVGRRLAAGGAQ